MDSLSSPPVVEAYTAFAKSSDYKETAVDQAVTSCRLRPAQVLFRPGCQQLGSRLADCSRDGFLVAMDVSDILSYAWRSLRSH